MRKSKAELSESEREKIVDRRFEIGSYIIFAVCVVICAVWLVTQKLMPYIKYQQGIRTIKAEAIEYVRDKYGIDAEIKYEDTFDRFFYWDKGQNAVCSGTIVMISEDREFMLIEDNYGGSYTYRDNYQSKEIDEAVQKEIERFLPGAQLVSVSIYTEGSYALSGMFGKDIVYDGENLDDVLSRCSINVKADYIDTNLDSPGLTSWLDSMNADAELLSFDTKAHYDQYINTIEDLERNGQLTGSVREQTARRSREIMPYLPYLNDTLLIGSAYEDSSYELESYGDILYCHDDPEKNDEVTLAEISAETFAENFNNGEMKGTPISPAYQFKGNDCNVTVYYPIDKLKSYDEETVRSIINIATFESGYQKTFRTDDYAVFCLHHKDPEFMLVDKSENTQ